MEQSVKEVKQWWSTAKQTLKCDEYDAIYDDNLLELTNTIDQWLES